MKYINTFDTKRGYKTAKKNHTLRLPNVSIVKPNNQVFTRPAFVSKEYAEAGDIIVYSKEAYEAWTNAESGSTAEAAAYQTLLETVAYMKPEYFDATAAQKYLPDAIVVVPCSHTGDGTVRAMSLKYMSPSNPENGSITNNTGLSWGAYGVLDGINRRIGVAVVVNPSLGEASTLSGATTSLLPSDTFTTLEVPGSDGEFYWLKTEENHAPCPYRVDGSLNRQYLGEYGINSRLTSNCLGDMDGIHNTKAIINALNKTYINDTLFGNTITNAQTQTIEGVTTNIFPAAMCCQRYHTVLKPNAITYDSENDTYAYGDWYMPSAGEFGYVAVNQGSIGYALNQINTVLPNMAVDITGTFNWYWTSTEQGRNMAWYIGLAVGRAGYNAKIENDYQSGGVRAFAAF